MQNLSHVIESQQAQMESKYSQLTTQTLSHELMTPLNSMSSLSELSLDIITTMITEEGPVDKSNLEEVREYIQVANTSS